MIRLVTGTGTEVGKTVATAALCSAAASSGRSTCMIKPVQTGLLPGEPGDAAEVQRLAGVETHEFVRYPDPLAPEAAARRSGAHHVTVAGLAEQILGIAREHGQVFVEGAGGLLVRLNDRGETFADLAVALGCPVIVVVAPELGTLNHTALTVLALQQARVPLEGIVIGSWPADPSLACRENLIDLANYGPLLGRLPARAAALPPEEFRRLAPAWLPVPDDRQR